MERVRRDVVIRTERCLIRPPRPSDYTVWARLRSASRAFLEPWEPAWPEDALSMDDWRRRMRAWRDGWERDRSYVFLIFHRKTAALLGGFSLSNVRRGPAQAASLGYWLGEGEQGRGYMAEAVGAACQWAEATLGLKRLEAGTVPENARSQKVLATCGFEREGYARAYLEIAGVRRDHVLYARLLDGGSSEAGP